MKTTNINKLPLLDCWYDSDSKKRWKVNLPFTSMFPLWSGVKTEESSVVYFEIEPGYELGDHFESSEEILYVISGTAEVTVDNEQYQVSEGELVVIPPSITHQIKNNGEEVAKFLGFFASSESRSTFSEEVSPVGLKVL